MKTIIKLLCLPLLFSLATSTVEAQTLKIATAAPDGTTWMKKMRQAAKNIKIQTDGRIKIKLYPGGVMGDDKSVFRKMRIGQLHGGAFTAGSLSHLYADIQIYSLPMLFQSYGEVNYVRQRMDKVLKEGLAKKGLIALGISDGGFAYVMSDSKVSDLQELRAKKLWVPEGDVLTRSVYESADLSPISLPLSDVYTGLQTGLIDTVTGPPVATIAFQWHTKVTHLTDTPLMYLTGIFALDKKAFNRIPASDQVIVKKIIGDTFAELDRINAEDNKNAKIALEKQGIHFDPPTDSELETWRSISGKAIAKLGEKGVYTPAMLKKVKQYIQDFHAEQTALDEQS